VDGDFLSAGFPCRPSGGGGRSDLDRPPPWSTSLDIAGRIAEGDLRARVDDASQDEIGRVAGAIDATARHLERTFAAVRLSQYQLETLLNSMQDAVIAVSADGLVQWANQRWTFSCRGARVLQAPVVETIGTLIFWQLSKVPRGRAK